MGKFVILIHCEGDKDLGELNKSTWKDTIVVPGLDITKIQVAREPKKDKDGNPVRGSRCSIFEL
jgi:hypothetical protein